MNYNYIVINKVTEKQFGKNFDSVWEADIYAAELNEGLKTAVFVVIKS